MQAAAEAEAAAQAAAKAEAPAEREPSAQEAQAEHGELHFTAGKEFLLDTAAHAIDKATAAWASVKDRVGDVSAYTLENGTKALDAGKQVLNDVAAYAVENVPAAWAAAKDRVGNASTYTVENGKWALDTGKQVVNDVTSYAACQASAVWASATERVGAASSYATQQGQWAWDSASDAAAQQLGPVWAAAKEHGAQNASLYQGTALMALAGAAVLPPAAPVFGAAAVATAIASLHIAGGDNIVADGLKSVGEKIDAPAAIVAIYGAALIKGACVGYLRDMNPGAQALKTLRSIDFMSPLDRTEGEWQQWALEVQRTVAQAENEFSSYGTPVMTGMVKEVVAQTHGMLVAAGTAVATGLLPALYDYAWGEPDHRAVPCEALDAPAVALLGSATPDLAEAL